MRVAEASDADVVVALRQVCTDIALSLSDALSDYHRFKARRDDSLKSLEELASLKARKHTFLTQHQAETNVSSGKLS